MLLFTYKKEQKKQHVEQLFIGTTIKRVQKVSKSYKSLFLIF